MLRTTSQFQLSFSPNVPSFLYCMRMAISILWNSTENMGAYNGNANIVPNGFPSQESFKTYVNLCKPKRNTYLQ